MEAVAAVDAAGAAADVAGAAVVAGDLDASQASHHLGLTDVHGL